MAGLQSILLPNWLGYFSDCLHPYSRAPYWTRSISLGFKGDGSEIFFPLYQIRKLDLRKQSFSKAPQHWVFHCKHSGPNPVCVPLHQGHPGAHKIISQVPRRNFSWQFFPYFNVHQKSSSTAQNSISDFQDPIVQNKHPVPPPTDTHGLPEHTHSLSITWELVRNANSQSPEPWG